MKLFYTLLNRLIKIDLFNTYVTRFHGYVYFDHLRPNLGFKQIVKKPNCRQYCKTNYSKLWLSWHSQDPQFCGNLHKGQLLQLVVVLLTYAHKMPCVCITMATLIRLLHVNLLPWPMIPVNSWSSRAYSKAVASRVLPCAPCI